jgi:hypothetical protein
MASANSGCWVNGWGIWRLKGSAKDGLEVKRGAIGASAFRSCERRGHHQYQRVVALDQARQKCRRLIIV